MCVAQDWSPGTWDIRIPCLRMEATRSSGQPAATPHGTEPLVSGTASPRTDRRQPPALWHGRPPGHARLHTLVLDRRPRATRGQTRRPVWLAHASPKTGDQRLRMVSHRSARDQNPCLRDGQSLSRRMTTSHFTAWPANSVLEDGPPGHGRACPGQPLARLPSPGIAVPELLVPGAASTCVAQDRSPGARDRPCAAQGRTPAHRTTILKSP